MASSHEHLIGEELAHLMVHVERKEHHHDLLLIAGVVSQKIFAYGHAKLQRIHVCATVRTPGQQLYHKNVDVWLRRLDEETPVTCSNWSYCIRVSRINRS